MPAEKTKAPSTTVAVQVQHNLGSRGCTITPRENSWHRFILGETWLYNLPQKNVLRPDDSPAASRASKRICSGRTTVRRLPARAKEFAPAGRQSGGFQSVQGAGLSSCASERICSKGRSGGYRQGEPETAAPPHLTLDPYLATVSLDQVTGDG